MDNANKIMIDLPNGYKLVAEQNTDPSYPYEMFIGLKDRNGFWHQDLAVVRNLYSYGEDLDEPLWDENVMEVLVYGDENSEDYTNRFKIGIYHDEI